MGTCFARDELCVHYSEHLLQQWTPLDPAQDWLLDRELTGRVHWLCGDGAAAIEDGFDIADQWPTGRFRAPHGDFYAELHGHRPAAKVGSWANPTEAFLAGLPATGGDAGPADRRQPARPRLHRPVPERRERAADVPGPAELRAVLYAALRRMPAVSSARPTTSTASGTPPSSTTTGRSAPSC